MQYYDLIDQLVRAKQLFQENLIAKAVYLTGPEGIKGDDIQSLVRQGLLHANDDDGFVCVVFLKEGQELPACIHDKLHGYGYEHANLWLEKTGEMDCWSDVETDASLSGLVADILLYCSEMLNSRVGG